VPRPLAAEKFRQFGVDALDADPAQFGGGLRHGDPGVVIDPEAELRHETSRAEQPERVFVETELRIADRPHHRQVKIGLPVEGIDQFAGQRVRGHRVDREIAPAQIVLERHPVLDRRLARGIGVGLLSVGGDLDREGLALRIACKGEPDGAELLADKVDRARSGALAEFRRLFGRTIGGEIEIGGSGIEQQIAHRTADQIKLTTGGGEGFAEPGHHPPVCGL